MHCARPALTRLAALAALLVSLALPNMVSAHALRLDPSSLAVFANQTFSLDLIVSDLDGSGSEPGSLISGYDLHVSFDSTRIEGIGAQASDALGDLGDAFFSATVGGDNIHLEALSLLSDADLAARQGSEFRLATLSFRALGLGAGESEISTEIFISTLTALLGGCTVKDGETCLEIQDDANTGTGLTGSTVRVRARPTQVPEPGALLLMALALGAVARAGRKTL